MFFLFHVLVPFPCRICFKFTFLFKLVTKKVFYLLQFPYWNFYFVFCDSLMFLDLMNLIIFDYCNSGTPQLVILSLISFLHPSLFQLFPSELWSSAPQIYGPALVWEIKIYVSIIQQIFCNFLYFNREAFRCETVNSMITSSHRIVIFF